VTVWLSGNGVRHICNITSSPVSTAMGDRFPGYAVLVRNQSLRSTELLSGMGMSTGQGAMAGKVTEGQASHWPRIIDSVVCPVGSYGLNGLKREQPAYTT